MLLALAGECDGFAGAPVFAFMTVFKAVFGAFIATAPGCFTFSMPPKVPTVEQTQLPPDTFLDLEIGSARERHGYTEKSDVCSRGGSDCVEVRTRKHEILTVRTATATADGKPVKISTVAVSASPEFVADTQHLRSLTSHCKRGRIVMTLGGLGLTAAYFLLSAGYANERKPAYIVGGFAALGGGFAVMGAGRFMLGGQDCKTAEELYAKWSPIYEDPDATTVKRRTAEMLATLVDKFNQDHAAARAQSEQPDAPEEPAPADE